MNADAQLAHIRLLGKTRAKKHYDANKEAINAKRRERYALKHGLQVQAVEPIIEQVDEPIVEPAIPKKKYEWADIIGDPPVIEQQVAKKSKKAEKQANESLTFEIVKQKIKDLNIEKKSSEKKYIDDIKRTMKMTKCDDLLQCLQNPKKIIDLVNKAKMNNGNLYSINTKKSVFQAILFVIDNLKLPIDKKLYNKEFEIYKVKSSDQNAEKVATQEVPTFTEYLKQSRSRFGMDSKEYIIARFYDELTVRDDFGLTITDKDQDGNYLLVTKNYLEIIINDYKTEKKYGQIRYKLKKSLENLTREYIIKKKLGVGDSLFGHTQLSAVASKMNKELGYKGGTNLFRHMKITSELQNASPEDRVRLAEIMRHSPVVQIAYLRKLKLI